MPNKLHIDIETFSSVDIMKAGAYKYVESIDFEILMVAYAFNDDQIKIVDLAAGESLPNNFLAALEDPDIIKCAHNANFERNAFRAIGLDIPIEQWECTQVKAAYCGLPLSLEMVSSVLELNEKAKLGTGKALIKYFSVPQKPTKANSFRHRNFWMHDLEKWEEFKRYCMMDVEAEREIDNRLAGYKIPKQEIDMYILDQQINDTGIMLDLKMAENATYLDELNSEDVGKAIKELTNIENPNSAAQLKQWLSVAMKKEIKSLAKEELKELLKEAEAGYFKAKPEAFYTEKDLKNLGYIECAHGGYLHKAHPSTDFYGAGILASELLAKLNKAGPNVSQDTLLKILKLRQKAAKTSTKKYIAMLNSVCDDLRIHGLFQFYGANRTGRWAGRLVQMQNLPQNHLDNLDEARNLVVRGDYELMQLYYDNISDVLSQLIRTTFIAPPGKTLAVADFSAIEARVIAWLAGEQWRLDVFATHGKIYEASASMMFGIPLEEITKGSPERQKGKVAELALGYQGALGALKKMGGEAMGLSDIEMTKIVRLWRKENPKIVDLWKAVETAAIKAVKSKELVVLSQYKNLEFESDGNVLTIKLPSGRKLFYQTPRLTTNKFGKQSIKYKGLDQVTKKWWWVDSYGGKFVENIVQAFARDLLAYSMLKLDKLNYKIVMHVHDEVVCEIPQEDKETTLEKICYIMGSNVPWAPGLDLKADGYTTDYYKKD